MNRKARRAARKHEPGLDPDGLADQASDLSVFAKTLIADGDFGAALLPVSRLLDLSPTAEAKEMFLICMSSVRFESATPELHATLIRAVTDPRGSGNDLSKIVCPIIKLDPNIAADMASLRADPAAQLSPRSITAAAKNRLLLAALEALALRDAELEQYLTACRAALLDDAVNAKPHGNLPPLAFTAALARQCFNNEFVFAELPEETSKVDALEAVLHEALRAGIPTPQSLAILAAYRPLGRLASAKTILRRKWPAMLDGLITQQVREPLTESVLLTRIPRLTAIDSDTSIAVQRQYEENPYPRWIKAKPVAAPIVLERDLRRNFPHAALEAQSFSDQPEILIAGCGTGQQVVDHARLFPRAPILAMDLSLTSLSYAARKAEEYKLRNVEFAQADIMKIADLKRQFDLVISDGVLHHLSDPAEGWRQLVSVLRPGGFMRISLYSDIARRDVVAAQNFVRERGFPPSPDGIRRSRQAILASENPELKSVTMIPDFFTLSETRDLLFHEQEHRLSLPWIREFVDANGLELLGFIVDSSTRKKYRARFPEDEGMDNLETWHRFEQEHPATFLGMYQFWLQRPRVARALMTSSSLR